MRLVKRLPVLAIALTLPLAACGGSDDDDGGEVCDFSTATTYTYVVDTAIVPTTPSQATDYAFDLDGVGAPEDNTLGMVIATLASQADLDVSTAVSDAINAGDVILLTSLETDNLSAASCARMGVFLGDNPGDEPCDANGLCGGHLQGGTTFDIAASSPRDTKLEGQILGSGFNLGPNDEPGNFTIELDIADLAMPLTLNLAGARVSVDSISDNNLMSGLIGGAITQEDLDTSIMPAIHGVVADVVDACVADQNACCPNDAAGQTVVDLFDTDADCSVSLAELTENDLIRALLAPDVDLFDGTTFAPGVDGIPDSLSIGLGFTAIGAEFVVP